MTTPALPARTTDTARIGAVPVVLTTLFGLAILASGSPDAIATPADDTRLYSDIAQADHRAHPLHAAPTSVAPPDVSPPADLHRWHFDTRLERTMFDGGFAHIVVDGRPVITQRSAPAAEAPDAIGDVDDFVVMLDPGHGGSDPGAEATNGLLEKELTRDIAERTQRFLSEVPGVRVVLTRDGDEGLSRQRRVDRIRDSGADLVLSLHFNHLPQQDVALVESYYAGPENIAESLAVQHDQGLISVSAMSAVDTTFTEGSARLARYVQRRVFGEVSHANPSATDAGVKRDTLFVLTRSFVPGALVELSCVSNPGEAERLASPLYRARLAAALADAVRDYRRSVAERPLGDIDV